MPPMMVAPERLVPGTSARHCARPTASASRGRISSIVAIRIFGVRRSAQRMTKPPTMKVVATTAGVKRCSLTALPNSRPSTTAGTKAIATLSAKRRARASLPRPASGLREPLPVDDDHGDDRAGLDRDVEHLALGVVEAEQRAGEDQVAGARDRQELGQALDDAHQGGPGEQHQIQRRLRMAKGGMLAAPSVSAMKGGLSAPPAGA